MIINTEWLKEKNASNDLITWFADRFPNGGDLQSVLDQACADIRPGEASWILKHAGRNDSVYAAETLKAKHFVFAGSIKISGPIEIDGFIEAGWGIEAGEDFCIFAGLRVMFSKWKIYALVSAKTKPVNLISGFWKDHKNEEHREN